MAVENVNTITELNIYSPASTDPLQEGDDHLRLLKSVLKNCFPNIGGPVTLSHTQLNDAGTYTNGLNAYSKSLLAKVDAPNWRSTLGLGSAATYAHTAFAPVSHGHYVNEVLGAVPEGRALTTWNGLGLDRGNGSLSDALDLTSNVRIGLRPSGATPGTYGSATKSPVITVDSFGRVTSVSTANISSGGGGGGTVDPYEPPTNANTVGTYKMTAINDVGVSGQNSQLVTCATGNTVTFNPETYALGQTWRCMSRSLHNTIPGGGGDTTVNTITQLWLRIS